MNTAQYYRDKADDCRRLANCILSISDPMYRGLLALALEFDAMALAAGGWTTPGRPT
ncbi:MAG: hypothetical protein ACLQJR_05860 [Stellaceae bacterium]